MVTRLFGGCAARQSLLLYRPCVANKCHPSTGRAAPERRCQKISAGGNTAASLLAVSREHNHDNALTPGHVPGTESGRTPKWQRDLDLRWRVRCLSPLVAGRGTERSKAAGGRMTCLRTCCFAVVCSGAA